jgi:uncharacterized membrane protein
MTHTPMAPGRQRGSVTPMIIGFCVILLMLIGVVTAASKVFLVQRQLASVADAAALAGADAVDTAAIYQTSSSIRLDPAAVDAAVAQYVELNGSSVPRGTAITYTRIDADLTVRVGLAAQADIPALSSILPASIRVTADSSAQGLVR